MDDSAIVAALELRLLAADVRRSRTEVARLLHADFMEFGSSGRVFDKAGIVTALANEGAGEALQRSVEDMKVSMVSGDIALVTYRACRKQRDHIGFSTLRSSIWARTDGAWQMIFHQGTPIPSATGGD